MFLFKMLSRFVIAFLPRNKGLLISQLQSWSAVILEPKKKTSITVSIVSSPICHEVMGLECHDFRFLNVEFWASFLTLLFNLHQDSLGHLHFCHKGAVICIPEVINNSPGNLDSSLCLFSLALCMMYPAYKLNKQGDNIQPWLTRFPIWNQSIVPCLVPTVASWLAYSFLRRQIRWCDVTISLSTFHSLLWSTESKVNIVNEVEVDIFFWNSLAFSIIQRMLAMWYLVLLPYLKPAWTFGSSQLMYCWSLAWRIFTSTLLAYEISAVAW